LNVPLLVSVYVDVRGLRLYVATDPDETTKCSSLVESQ